MQQEGRTMQHAIAREHGNHVRVDRGSLSTATANGQPPHRLHGRRHRIGDGAILFANLTPVVVLHLDQARAPLLLHDRRALDACQAFRSSVPQYDFLRAVDEDHRVMHAVDQLLLEQAAHGTRLSVGLQLAETPE